MTVPTCVPTNTAQGFPLFLFLSNFDNFNFIYFQALLLEKTMATHSSTLAWKILWTEEPGRLQSMGSHRVGHDWATSLSLFTFHALEKEMATHSSVLAWRIPGRAEPGGLPSMGSHSQTGLKRLSSSSSRLYYKVYANLKYSNWITSLWDVSLHFKLYLHLILLVWYWLISGQFER